MAGTKARRDLRAGSVGGRVYNEPLSCLTVAYCPGPILDLVTWLLQLALHHGHGAAPNLCCSLTDLEQMHGIDPTSPVIRVYHFNISLSLPLLLAAFQTNFKIFLGNQRATPPSGAPQLQCSNIVLFGASH